MANTDPVEFQLLASDFTTELAILPADSANILLQLNASGSGALNIPVNSYAASIINSSQFIRVNYRGSAIGGFFVDDIDKVGAGSGEGTDLWYKITGRGMLAILSDAVVWNNASMATTRTFTNASMGSVFKTLLDEALARGCFSMLTYDFSATQDSLGNSWTDSNNYSLDVGKTYLDLLTSDFSTLGIDFSITLSSGTMTLHAYKNGIGTNKSTTLFFRTGTNCEVLDQNEHGSEIKNALLVKYAQGIASVSDPTSISANRRRENLFDASQANAPALAATWGNAQLTAVKAVQIKITATVYDKVPPAYLVDYGIGDWVSLDNKGTVASYRVLSAQLSWENSVFADVAIGMNSLFVENGIRVAQSVTSLQTKYASAHSANLLEASLWMAIGLASDVSTSIYCLYLDGSNLYVGGTFTKIGGVSASNVAVYNISTGVWSALGTGSSYPVHSICKAGGVMWFGCDAGNAALGHLLKWDGATMTQVGSFSDGGIGYFGDYIISALATDGNYLYVGGNFPYATTTGTPVSNTAGIARYNLSSPAFTAMGTGLQSAYPASINAMLYDGANVIAGGNFTNMSGVSGTNYVAKWNGSVWSALATGAGGIIYSLCMYGTNLIAGGAMTGKIIYWNNTAWATFGGGVNNTVYALATDGLSLYAGGAFTDAGSRIAQWDGSEWIILSSGLNNTCYAIALDGSGNTIAGGSFTNAGGVTVVGIAEYFTSFNPIIGAVSGKSNGYDLGAGIHNATAGTLTAYSEFPFWDAVTSLLRKVTWGNIIATLETALNTVYMAIVAPGTTGNVLTSNGSAWTSAAPSGGGGSPGGSDTQVQYNKATAFGGDNNFIFDYTNRNWILNWAGVAPYNLSNDDVHLAAEGDSPAFAAWIFYSGLSSTATTGARFIATAARGTKASPTALQDGDTIGGLSFKPFDGVLSGGNMSNLRTNAQIVARAKGNQTSLNHGVALDLYTTPQNAGNESLQATLDENGLTGAVVQHLRKLTETMTILDTYCVIMAEYLDTNSYDLVLQGDADLVILN